MRKTIASLFLGLGLILLTPELILSQELPLRKVELNIQNDSVGIDEQLWGNKDKPGDYINLLRAIDHSLYYLSTPSAAEAYRNYPVSGIDRDRVRRSLIRFRELLINSRTPAELQTAIQKEFVFYQSVGKDDRATVSFTGYFEPVHKASRLPTAEYRYPLYRKPAGFDGWSNPHPTRTQLEGKDGLLGKQSPISGNELVWLRDRLEAFLVGVQGSARLQLTDGSTMTIGYDGSTAYPYTSLGRELVNDGKFTLEELTLPKVIEYFQSNPLELDKYLPRNNRFIFFHETNGAPPKGNLGVSVTGDRSIATDKSIMPPGALALIVTSIPYPNQTGELETHIVSRYVLDQDTGSAIKGPGRVDIFLGTGKTAGDRAGMLNSSGQLYYLLLKD